MPDCFAKDCKSRRSQSRKNKNQLKWEESHGQISFHRIPKEPLERKKWLVRMRLEASNIPETAALCSLHFNEKSLDRTSLSCTRLYPGAVPFEHPKEEESLPKQYIVLNEHSYHRPETADPMSNQQIIDNTEREIVGTSESNICSPEKCLGDSDIPDIPSTPKVSRKDACTSPGLTFATPETAVSQRLSDSIRGKRILQTALNNTKIACRKKIKMIQQKQRRTMKRFAKFIDALRDLRNKNLLDAQQLDILKDLGNFTYQFLQRQSSKLIKLQYQKSTIQKSDPLR